MVDSTFNASATKKRKMANYRVCIRLQACNDDWKSWISHPFFIYFARSMWSCRNFTAMFHVITTGIVAAGDENRLMIYSPVLTRMSRSCRITHGNMVTCVTAVWDAIGLNPAPHPILPHVFMHNDSYTYSDIEPWSRPVHPYCSV